MKTYLKYLFQLILSPRHGWEDIEKGDEDAGYLLSSGYYPLIAIMAASVYVGMLFHSHAEFIKLFVEMVVLFVVYFTGYFFGVFMLSVFLEPMIEGRYDDNRCRTFVVYTLGLSALITILFQCLPVTSLVLFFLPCYVALVEWKGTSYMRVLPEKVGLFMILAIFGILMPPYVFYYLFTLIL